MSVNQSPTLPDSVVPAEGVGRDADILIVDDNRSNLLAIEAALGELAHLVPASSGPEALRRLLDQDFALILLDVQMPTMDGFQTARLIRDRKRSRHTPIIFITAYSRDQHEVLQAYELGAVDFLFKPIVPEVLRAKASVFVDLHRRNIEVARQAELLREHERREHAQALVEERQRWEQESLQRQMEEERRAAAALARKAEELARTVAERERAERELTRINRELEEADRRKDEFIALLAHELRNPLAPIMTGCEVLRRASRPGGSQDALRRACAAVERQAQHLSRLVDDLLDVSRINSGKIELRRAVIELGTVVSQAVSTSQPEMDARGHALEIELGDEPLFVNADAVRLTQIVANLLNNAARYTPDGGHIRVSCAKEGDEALVTVRDDGQGIPSELIDRIFDMFVQRRAGGGGLGLGLTLVQRLVAMHGGSVSVKSDGVGKGSEFRVRLPLADADADAADEPPVERRQSVFPRDKALRIVVIDDNPDIRDTVRDLLVTYGHEVEVAQDGTEGVETVTRTKPDVVLVDIDMPGLDGYGVAERLRASEPESLRLVAMTGFGQNRDRERAFDAGFDAHLVKPASAEALLDALSGEERSRSQPAS